VYDALAYVGIYHGQGPDHSQNTKKRTTWGAYISLYHRYIIINKWTALRERNHETDIDERDKSSWGKPWRKQLNTHIIPR